MHRKGRKKQKTSQLPTEPGLGNQFTHQSKLREQISRNFKKEFNKVPKIPKPNKQIEPSRTTSVSGSVDRSHHSVFTTSTHQADSSSWMVSSCLSTQGISGMQSSKMLINVHPVKVKAPLTLGCESAQPPKQCRQCLQRNRKTTGMTTRLSMSSPFESKHLHAFCVVTAIQKINEHSPSA